MMNTKEMKNDEKIVIQIENLHIHMDERMDSTNIYTPNAEDDCCDCCACCDDKEQAIDMDELAMKVCKDVKFPLSIVECVLQSAEKILIEKGFLEEAEEEETVSETEGADETSDNTDTEETSELSDDEKKFLDDLAESVAPVIGMLAMLKTLKDLAESDN